MSQHNWPSNVPGIPGGSPAPSGWGAPGAGGASFEQQFQTHPIGYGSGGLGAPSYGPPLKTKAPLWWTVLVVVLSGTLLTLISIYAFREGEAKESSASPEVSSSAPETPSPSPKPVPGPELTPDLDPTPRIKVHDTMLQLPPYLDITLADGWELDKYRDGTAELKNLSTKMAAWLTVIPSPEGETSDSICYKLVTTETEKLGPEIVVGISEPRPSTRLLSRGESLCGFERITLSGDMDQAASKHLAMIWSYFPPEKKHGVVLVLETPSEEKMSPDRQEAVHKLLSMFDEAVQELP
ncbi:hypothetical protein [Tessaracoccus sp. OH4464_COT-324]|uniref:hypothetical protein n=1 Tax=Tessaracoccus sp. OH4464_COT-324 TaxID=2491059 RepID=UPI000F62F54A|nr:hypothetical protein [Tessaracoccus sp. OH4464_COT-324]RRD47776.1 hypothetical protein EII42_00535 [Tessaracoccus sp. OH4464_COT-324]